MMLYHILLEVGPIILSVSSVFDVPSITICLYVAVDLVAFRSSWF